MKATISVHVGIVVDAAISVIGVVTTGVDVIVIVGIIVGVLVGTVVGVIVAVGTAFGILAASQSAPT